jgi:hypothetical protein
MFVSPSSVFWECYGTKAITARVDMNFCYKKFSLNVEKLNLTKFRTFTKYL